MTSHWLELESVLLSILTTSVENSTSCLRLRRILFSVLLVAVATSAYIAISLYYPMISYQSGNIPRLQAVLQPSYLVVNIAIILVFKGRMCILDKYNLLATHTFSY
jgi:hypothetical protein